MPTADSFPLKTQGADGTPTYLLAVVVDDHDMGVTQVRSLIVELVEKHVVFLARIPWLCLFGCHRKLSVLSEKNQPNILKVIRGSDHIGNTARQIAVFKNMFLGPVEGMWYPLKGGDVSDCAWM